MNKLGHGPPSTRSTSNQSRNRRQQQQQQHQQRAVDNSDSGQDRRLVAAQTHTRTPVITRESSVFESLLRTFLPISITGTPPNARRRPLSFGGVIGSRTGVLTAIDDVQRASVPDGERITWAAWDELEHSRVLLLAYTSGFQMWDAGNLGAVRELLNLRIESLHHHAGPVLCAAVLPTPVEGTDDYEGVRPLLGVLSSTHFTIYSLSSHSIVKQISFPGGSSIVARPAFIVISTTHPHKLHILSCNTLAPLHSISLSTPPIFALSLRLLAYASPNPDPHTHPSPTFVSCAHDSLSASVLRVGGEVWSGVKAAVVTSAAGLGGADSDTPWGFSRSAPAASGLRDQFTHAHPDDAADTEDTAHADHAASTWVTVVDLKSLVSAPSVPRRVTCFAPFPREPSGIAHLAFSGVGGTPLLCVAPRDGQRVAVFQIRPGATAMEMPWHWYDLRRGLTSARVDGVVWDKAGLWVGVATGRRTVHVFPTNPYGGRPDERSHIDARVYNSLELPPLSTDVAPLVRLRPSTTTAPPASAPLAITFLSASSSLFLPPTLLPTSPSSAPAPPTPNSPPRSAPSSPVPVPTPGSTSPRPHARPHAHTRATPSLQDVLLFDPASGELSLRRIALDWAPPPVQAPTSSDTGAGELVGRESVVATWSLKRGHDWAEVRSVLPEAAGTRRVKSGSAASAPRPSKASTTTFLAQAELSTHSRSPAVLPRPIYLSHQFSFSALGEDYHALLRRAQLNVPCTPIHVRTDVQVSAYTSDDAVPQPFFHGAVDLQHPDPDGNLHGTHGTHGAHDSRALGAHGAFAAPLASAMRSGLDYTGQSPPVLPMLPNGAPLSVLDTIPMHTKHVAAGVNEGLDRIRRRVRSPMLRPRVEGRRVARGADEGAVMVRGEGGGGGDADADVDMDVVDIEVDDVEQESAARDDGSGSANSVSVSTPSSRFRADADPNADADSLWDVWDDEARAMVAEAETFDEISATGFMDEEQDHRPIMAAMSRKQGKRGKASRP